MDENTPDNVIDFISPYIHKLIEHCNDMQSLGLDMTGDIAVLRAILDRYLNGYARIEFVNGWPQAIEDTGEVWGFID
jgi:hypothetical protein